MVRLAHPRAVLAGLLLAGTGLAPAAHGFQLINPGPADVMVERLEEVGPTPELKFIWMVPGGRVVDEQWVSSGRITVPSGQTLVVLLPGQPAADLDAVRKAARFQYENAQGVLTTDIRDYWTVPVAVDRIPDEEAGKPVAVAPEPGVDDRDEGPAVVPSGVEAK
jgi:hypothetical protein